MYSDKDISNQVYKRTYTSTLDSKTYPAPTTVDLMRRIQALEELVNELKKSRK